MRFDFSARSRHADGRTIKQKHADLIKRWKMLPSPWGLQGKIPVPESNTPPGCDYFSIKRNMVAKVISASLLYSHRDLTEDEGSSDDNISIDFDSRKVDYQSFVNSLCPLLIEWFDAYVAEIQEDSILLADCESTLPGSNSRCSPQRISPVCFFDATLCQRAFGRKPREILKLLKPHVESVRLLGNGIFIVATSEPVGPEETNAIDRRLWPLITGKAKEVVKAPVGQREGSASPPAKRDEGKKGKKRKDSLTSERCLIDLLLFLELADDDSVDPDDAMRMIENITGELAQASDAEKERLRKAIEQVVAEENEGKPRGPVLTFCDGLLDVIETSEE